MFSAAFCGEFDLCESGVAGGFSGAFSVAFLRVTKSGGYICPVSAQRALLSGAAAVYDGGGLLIGGARLIGPAGKIFEFSSAENADMWAEINRARAARELELMAGLSAAAAGVYRARKAAALAKISKAVLTAAARQSDKSKQAALIAEAEFCEKKWGPA